MQHLYWMSLPPGFSHISSCRAGTSVAFSIRTCNIKLNSEENWNRLIGRCYWRKQLKIWIDSQCVRIHYRWRPWKCGDDWVRGKFYAACFECWTVFLLKVWSFFQPLFDYYNPYFLGNPDYSMQLQLTACARERKGEKVVFAKLRKHNAPVNTNTLTIKATIVTRI